MSNYYKSRKGDHMMKQHKISQHCFAKDVDSQRSERVCLIDLLIISVHTCPTSVKTRWHSIPLESVTFLYLLFYFLHCPTGAFAAARLRCVSCDRAMLTLIFVHCSFCSTPWNASLQTIYLFSLPILKCCQYYLGI